MLWLYGLRWFYLVSIVLHLSWSCCYSHLVFGRKISSKNSLTSWCPAKSFKSSGFLVIGFYFNWKYLLRFWWISCASSLTSLLWHRLPALSALAYSLFICCQFWYILFYINSLLLMYLFFNLMCYPPYFLEIYWGKGWVTRATSFCSN